MMLHYPANTFGQALVPYVKLDISKGAEILKSNLFGSGLFIDLLNIFSPEKISFISCSFCDMAENAC